MGFVGVALTFGFYLNPPQQPQAVFYHSQGKTRRAEKLRHHFFHIQDPSYFLQTIFQVVLVQNCIAAPTQPVVALVAGCCTGSTAGRGCTGTACARCTPGKAAQTAKNRFHSPPPSVETGFFSTKLTPKCN